MNRSVRSAARAAAAAAVVVGTAAAAAGASAGAAAAAGNPAAGAADGPVSASASTEAPGSVTPAAAAPAAPTVSSTGHGTALTPQQAAALEQTVSRLDVPFTVPLGQALGPVLGGARGAQLSGTIPALPVVPPAGGGARPAPGGGTTLLPDPLVPALDGAPHTPSLSAAAPLPDAAGRLDPNAVGLDLPSAPMDATGAALGLGRPLTTSDLGLTPPDGAVHTATRAMPAPAAAPTAGGGADAQGMSLGDVDPMLTLPHLQSEPKGGFTLDERTSGDSLTRPLDGATDSLNQTLNALHG